MSDYLDALLRDLPDLDDMLADLNTPPPAPTSANQTRREAAAILQAITDSTTDGKPTYTMSGDARRMLKRTARRWAK